MKIRASVAGRAHDLIVERENGCYRVSVDGVAHLVDVHRLEGEFHTLITDGRSYEVSVEVRRDGYVVRHGAAERRVQLSDPGREAREAQARVDGPQTVTSMMPGKVVRLLVAQGDAVTEGQGLLVVEAMKMENEIASPKTGRVRALAVKAGQAVEGGALLAVIE